MLGEGIKGNIKLRNVAFKYEGEHCSREVAK